MYTSFMASWFPKRPH